MDLLQSLDVFRRVADTGSFSRVADQLDLAPSSVSAAVQRLEQHLGVVEAVLAGDLELAERRLIGHFDESLAVVEERAAHALARMLDRRPR